MPRDHSREQPQWLLARHSALTARQLLRAYGLLCLFSLTIAAAFALRGIWTIPVFSVVELGLVAIALLHYLRHARDYEHIALRDGELIANVALAAGFADQAHFQRAFKQHFAATPGQYRDGLKPAINNPHWPPATRPSNG